MSRTDPKPLPCAPIGLSRVHAAGYVGISVNKFDELVDAGLMPKPRRIGSRKVWHRGELDAFFDALPSEADHAENPLDTITAI